MSGISYSKIVFGLKHHQGLYDCREVTELVRSLRIIISEHDAFIDACERPGLHYHGIIEHGKYNYDGNNAIAQMRSYCTFFKIEKCDNPEEFIVEMALPPKRVMVIEIANSFNLKTYYSKKAVVDSRLELSDFEMRISKMEAIKFILSASRTVKIDDIKNLFSFTPDQLGTLMAHSTELMHQKMLNQSILTLCGRFQTVPGNYYTLLESSYLIVEWCQYQNIDFKEFTMNLVKCLDRQVSDSNSLYFQGSYDSGVVKIINSIEEACGVIGEIDNESTGYSYVWEECLEKRCIIMRDPIFDERMIEELENIIKGICTLVPHRQSFLKWLHPTPVLVICSKNDQENNLYLQRLKRSFLQTYVNLKPYVQFSEDPRRLHPDWLNVLHECITKVPQQVSMDIDSSCDLNDEDGSSSPNESVSSTTPCFSSNLCSRQYS